MATLGRFFHPPDGSFLLLGPRGTGKTTFARTAFPEATVVNLLRPDVHREMISHPERLRELVLPASDRSVIVLDEVQRIPDLLTVVHDLLEMGRGWRFVLTGSSARKLRRGGTDLLAGRAAMRTMHPFMAAEVPDFDLARAMRIGLVPIVWTAADPDDSLAAYAGLYLEQEVRAEALTRKVGSFARFLEAVSFSHGAILNISDVARETQVSRKTVEGYLEVLDDLLLSTRLPVFTRRAARGLVSHPKLYLFDAGVYRSLRPRGPLDRPAEIDGAAFEGLVFQHLRAWVAYSHADVGLSYWRTRAGLEVDFVAYGSGTFMAIEVKNANVIRSADVRGLRAFRADYPEAELLLLHRGEDRLMINDVLCMPADAFLRNLTPTRTLSQVTQRDSRA
ncbi:MAG: ATP-binding protein [Gemmatimonadota bacterium]